MLAPDGSAVACEIRGGGPGTRETDLLSPASTAAGANAVLLTGGSAFGLGAADGVVRYLAERGVGFPTPAGIVPLVSAAVVYDLALGDGGAHPDADAGYAACAAAKATIEGGSVGVGSGCTVGKLRGPDGWTKGGLGVARVEVGEAALVALAAVNAFGDVTNANGSLAAGVWDGDGYVRTLDLLRSGEGRAPRPREATTLVCLVTDAALDKTQAWRVARAASAGVARAVDPSATAVDGDAVFCIATRAVEADLFALSALAAEATALAIRDGVASATSAPQCPTASERLA